MTETLFPLPESSSSEDAEESSRGVPRVVRPNRDQVELRASDLESLLPADHEARAVWEFVESLDVGPLYAQIGSVEGMAGRPATDPRIHLALWLYATLQGVGSARALARLTEEHDAYRWICGGVRVNHHSLSDFRVQQVAYLDRLLTQSVAVLMSQGLVQLHRVAQDGMRVRASAGASSFRRKPKLRQCLKAAQEQIERLRQELEATPEATQRRVVEARKRAAEDRHRRVADALEQMAEVEARKPKSKREKARVSTTDPQARIMKMADGGFRPAYNVQFAVDTETQIVVGVDLCGHNDLGQMGPMLDQLEDRYDRRPQQHLVDGGFVVRDDIEAAARAGTVVYAPVMKPRDPQQDRYEPRPADSPGVAAWRQRMATEDARTIYKQRASTVECVNALARQRGLRQFNVRGPVKTRAVTLWSALAHNLKRCLSLGTPLRLNPA